MVRKERNIIMEMEFHSLSAEHCLLRSMVIIVLMFVCGCGCVCVDVDV